MAGVRRMNFDPNQTILGLLRLNSKENRLQNIGKVYEAFNIIPDFYINSDFVNW